jgi:drug/metabolite transporter (DMT)-like permease
MVMAVVAAIASACGFAVSTSLQHRAASGAPSRARGAVALVRYLAGQRSWLLGLSIGALSFCLHALALNLGPIALVQPIMVSGIVFAVVVRAALERTRPTATELSAVSVTAVGLSVFLAMSEPALSDSEPKPDRAAMLVLGGLLVVGVVAVISRGWPLRLRAAALGIAAGLTFGLTAGLVKLITSELGDAVLGLGTVAAVLALAVSGFIGVALNQQAYRLAPLSASMPVLNVVSVGLAVVFGAVVFDERPALGVGSVAGQVSGLVLIGLGLWIIAARVSREGFGHASPAEPSQRGGGRP